MKSERPLTLDEQIRVRAFRRPFAEAKRKIVNLVPEGEQRDLALDRFRRAEDLAVEALEAVMREGKSG